MVNEQVLKGNWNEIEGQIRNRWGRLTRNDLQAAEGNFEQLVGLIQRKTGESRSAIERYLESLTGDECSQPSHTAETARQYGRQAVRRALDRSRQAAGWFQHGFGQAPDSFRRGYEDAEQLIQHRPAESLAVSFGIGVLAGVLLGLCLHT